MKQQSRSTGRSRPQTSIVGGFNIYHDDKNRTIYYNRLSKRAYIIKPNDFNTFRTYSMRIFLALAVIVVLFSFSDTFLANPLFAIGVGVLVFVVLQVKFNGFLNRCTSIANFDTKHAYGYIQLLAIEETRRIWMKILLFTALAVFATGSALAGRGRKKHNGHCDGDCANCPPHYGYRYGRWYYGKGHQYGCEFGGNKRDGSL